jgi:hypothetical protein
VRRGIRYLLAIIRDLYRNGQDGKDGLVGRKWEFLESPQLLNLLKKSSAPGDQVIPFGPDWGWAWMPLWEDYRLSSKVLQPYGKSMAPAFFFQACGSCFFLGK